MLTKKIIVKGKVQGVNFRNSLKQKADELLIKGEVRNLPNGDLEIIATADELILFQLIDWCYEGPPGARVEKVIVGDMPLKWCDDFSIVRGR